MTDPVAPARPKTARALVALAATGILGVLSPVAAAPAAAAPVDAACPGGFGATAASNTLALSRVDLRDAGFPQSPVLPELRVATTHSGLAGGPARTAADARYLQSRGDFPPGVLGAKAYQEAPPPHDEAEVVPVEGADLGAVRLGTGGLRAHATWKSADRCDPSGGPRAASDARLAALTVLPGKNGRALLRFGAIESGTVTEVGEAGGRTAAVARATGGIADFHLLAGSPSEIRVQVVSPPSLRVVAGGTKTVDYTAPVLEVTLPGQAPIRVNSAGSHVDVVVPIDAGGAGAAGDLGRSEGLPVLGGVPLTELLTGVAGALTGAVPGATSAGPPERDVNGLLGGLPDLPVVGGLLGGGGAPVAERTAPTRPQPAGTVAVLRIELGSVAKQFSTTGAYAKAAAVRVKLIARSTWKSTAPDDAYGHGGAGPADQTVLVELGVCTLEAAAAAPKRPTGRGHGSGDGGYGHHGGGTGSGTSDDGGVATGGGQPDSLPVTGNRVGLALGGGVLLVVAGRMLQVLARRRSAL